MRRRYIILFCVVTALVIVHLSYVAAVKAARWGKTQYYTKVITSTPTDNGYESWQFEYSLPSYTADGVVREIEFTASKILRRDVYLRVYAKDDGLVTAWEEVAAKDVPPKALALLH
jgi:uncharacterized protein (TIGR01655 family)